MNDPIIDMMIRIKNGYMTKNELVFSPYSKYRETVLKKIQQYGYIKNYIVNGDGIKHLEIELEYVKGMPKMTDIKILSKPGRRYYVTYNELKTVMSGMGYSFLSTTKGIMTNKEARREKMGGELLFMIW